MTLQIQNKRSSVGGKVPLPADLDDGEIALNYSNADPALYIKDSLGNVIRLAGEGCISDEWSQSGTDLYPILATSDVKIGGTLPATPNITLSASGDINLDGDITSTTVDDDFGITVNGTGVLQVTEYNLAAMEVVTKCDIGAGANEVPVNGFLGTLAYKDDLATQDGLTVADLPASPVARVGNIFRVTDGAAALAWGTTVTGGGTAQYLVWYNGTSWTVFGA